MATLASDSDPYSNKQCKLSTNWAIAAGSLSATVTVESSADCETLEDSDASKPQSSLLLVPSSSESDPCEIKIVFTQKQEVRQVYVRSTSRVFEIYSARSPGSSNDYLCTVRCGIAIRGDEVLHATDVESVGAHPKESNGEQEKDNCSSSEDDWVEVKVLDMPSKDKFMREKNCSDPRRNLQDLYEATAEFTDSDACTTLTLRLLSLQTKDKVNIDEIYIFADPADSADSEAQAAPVGNLATTSLMSVLVPTLLQLSKSSNPQRQDSHALSSSGKGEYLDVGSKVNHSTDSENELELKIDEAVTKVPEVLIPEHESDRVQRYNVVSQTDVLNNRIESLLVQLVSRVNKIEDMCLRFEENMLNPIKSMDQRLQLVEEQVQVLVNNSQHSKLPSYTRISVPEFSCGESISSSFHTEGNENPSCGEVERKDTTFTRISAPEFSCGESMSSSFHTEGNENPSCGEVERKDTISDHVPNLSHVKLQSALVITAPEFSYPDDEENNDGDDEAKDGTVESVNDFPKEKPRQGLSIDDALDAALFGFMANINIQPAHYTQALTPKAPEFSLEESSDDVMAAKQNESLTVPPIFCSESNGSECRDGVVSSSSGDIGQDKLESDCVNGRSENVLESQTDGSQLADSTGVGEASAEKTDPVSVKDDILDVISERTEVKVGKGISENTFKLAEDGEYQNAESTDGEPRDGATISVSGNNQILEECSKNTETEFEKSSLDNSIIDSPWLSREVDFDLPILDVKFTSSDFVSTSSLEALFDDMLEASSTEQKNEDEKTESIANTPLADNQLLFDWEVNDVAGKGLSGLEGQCLNESLARDTQDNFASLL